MLDADGALRANSDKRIDDQREVIFRRLDARSNRARTREVGDRSVVFAIRFLHTSRVVPACDGGGVNSRQEIFHPCAGGGGGSSRGG